MRTRLSTPNLATLAAFSLVFSSTALTSCSSAPVPISPTPTVFTQNWQIQTGSSIAPAHQGGIFLAGALNIQGSQVTGLFYTNGSPCMGPAQVDPYTGSYNASTGALTVNTTYGVIAELTVPSTGSSMSTGTLGGGGDLCQIVTGGIPSVGTEIPSLTGGFKGKVSSPSDDGTATLTLAQAPTASPDATFALTGTLKFTSTTCTASIPLTGTILGATYTLAAASPAVTLSGLDNVGGSKLPTATIAFHNGPCNSGTASTYTGDLTQQ